MIAAAGDQTEKRDKTMNFKEMTEEGLNVTLNLDGRGREAFSSDLL